MSVTTFINKGTTVHDRILGVILAEYHNFKNSLTKNLTTNFIITNEEGNQFTIEQVRAKSIMSDTKIKKPRE